MRHRLRLLCAILAMLGITLGCAGQGTVSPAAGGGETLAEPVIADIANTGALAMIGERGDDPAFHIIDVRTPAEYDAGHIAGAVNLDYNGGVFEAALDSLDRDGDYLLYCRRGGRSAGARSLMAAAGFASVYNMLGGMDQWRADGLPAVE